MVKRFLTAAMVFALIFATLPAARAGVFDDACSFQLAKAVKLGRGATVTSGIAGQIGGKAEMSTERECDPNCENCDKKTGECLRCKENYYLYDNACHDCPQYAKCDGTPAFTCPVPEYFKEGFLCHKCADLIPHCVACVNETKCTACEAPYVLSDDGTACVEPPTCAGTVAKDETVAMATDAATFAEAVKSSKNVIFIANDISGVATTDLGSKKLVGPKYFSDIAMCKTEATPTLGFGGSSNLTMAGGSIEQLSVSFATPDVNAISGSGTINNATITSGKTKNVISASGKMTLSGSTKIVSSDENTSSTLRTTEASDTFEITNGSTSFDGNVSTVAYINEGTLSITSSGTFVSNAKAYNVVYLYGGKLIANGPIKTYSVATYALQQWGVHAKTKPSMTLNASGNVLTSYYDGFYATDGSITVNGSTTINFVPNPNPSDGSAKTGFDMHEVYTNSVIALNINAPITITGLTKRHDDKYPSSTGDEILHMIGGNLQINGEINNKSGIGKVFINGEPQGMSGKGAILGVSYMYGYDRPFNVSAGARLQIGGVCKKAATSGSMKLSYDNGIKAPIAPFNSGC